MLTQTEEPPSTFARAVLSSCPEPRHYLAVEGERLYPFTIDTRPIFEHYLGMVAAPLSDYTFANNFIWLSQRSGFYGIVENCFCLFALDGHCLSMPLPPLGYAEFQRRALPACFDIMQRYNDDPFLGAVEFAYADFAHALEAHWLVERSLPDYIYRTEDLILLRGNAFKSKRSEINQFRREHPEHRVEVLHAGHFPDVRALIDTWLHNRLRYLSGEAIAEFLATVEHERQAIERALAHYDTLGLRGLALVIGNRLEGFTFGERITPQVANVLVEKTNFTIAGSAQYLFREFTKMFADCSYINVGDDLGLENLRRVKLSYRPTLFGEKVTIRRRA